MTSAYVPGWHGTEQLALVDGFLVPMTTEEEIDLAKAYNEDDHPRDDHGRWSDGTGGMDVATAAYDYKRNGYEAINGDLRSGRLNPETSTYVAVLDKAIAAQPKIEIDLWRGDGERGISRQLFKDNPPGIKVSVHSTRNELKEANRVLNQKYVGKVFTDRAFISTSERKSVAMDFVNGSLNISGKTGVSGLVEITGRARSLDMEKASGGLRSHEREHLLARGKLYRVESAEIRPHPYDLSSIYVHWKVKVL